MIYKSWDRHGEIELLNCPFCGGIPKIKYIGNEATKRKAIEIKCPNCRISRKDAAMTHGFIWLEKISSEHWNRRVKEYESDPDPDPMATKEYMNSVRLKEGVAE